MLGAWMLILVFTRVSYNGGIAAHHVPFKTEAACKAAGTLLIEQYRKSDHERNNSPRGASMITAICARTE